MVVQSENEALTAIGHIRQELATRSEMFFGKPSEGKLVAHPVTGSDDSSQTARLADITVVHREGNIGCVPAYAIC